MTAESQPRTHSVVRIVAGSLAFGAATALALTVGVFGGGTEAVITGSALLAFGLGWAMLAVLTSRRTDQPQAWAAVPAVTMGATGAVLLLVRPEAGGMAAFGWAWPPVALAVAVWSLIQVRRSLTGRGRWLVVPVLVAMGLASAGATYENITVANQPTAGPGHLYDVDGHRLYLDCRGQGGPTVVLANGLGETTVSWDRILTGLGATTRVCAYDRPGQGWSEATETPQDAVQAATDLHTLLAQAGEHGPFVLVGHSSGGPYSMTYAARYPREVAGLVLLDSSSPEQATIVSSFSGEYAVMRRVVPLLPSLDRLGLARLVPGASHLPAPAASRLDAYSASARGAASTRDEQSVLLDVFRQAQALHTLHAAPLAVVTATENLSQAGWGTAQDRMAQLSTNHLHVVVPATHVGLLEDTSGAAASVRAINEVLTAVRTGTPLPTR